MGILFFIIGALLKTHPPVVSSSISKASQAMAGLLYIYVVAYSWGWGPVPWIYCADIFPNRTRHYGLAFASAVQWFWSKFLYAGVASVPISLFALIQTLWCQKRHRQLRPTSNGSSS
jgi:Sugar (and other) transporter